MQQVCTYITMASVCCDVYVRANLIKVDSSFSHSFYRPAFRCCFAFVCSVVYDHHRIVWNRYISRKPIFCCCLFGVDVWNDWLMAFFPLFYTTGHNIAQCANAREWPYWRLIYASIWKQFNQTMYSYIIAHRPYTQRLWFTREHSWNNIK